MNRRHMLFLFCVMTYVLLMVLDGTDTIIKAAMGDSSEANLKKRMFVKKLDASNFLRKQEKRSAHFKEENNDRTHREHPRSELEAPSEEDKDEQDDRSQEWTAYWPEYLYEFQD